jgi:hypothetical protein
MKKLSIIVVSLLTLTLYSCGGNDNNNVTPTSPTSSNSNLSITFQGNTYTSSIVTTETIGPNPWFVTMSGGDSKTVSISFNDFSSFSATYGVGTYHANTHIPGTVASMQEGGQCTLVNYNQGNAGYSTDDADTTSYVTVTIANSSECKGTFNIRLNDGNGNYYPTTGEFDYKH